MKPSINVLFPVAGDGLRFGGCFKPLLDATEKKFIELAKEPFDTLKSNYDLQFYFIFRQDQEDMYEVKKNLLKLFPNESIHFCIIPTTTKGPLHTIQTALNMYSINGLSFVCDCDHMIDITPLKNYIDINIIPDIIVPIWKYEENDYKSWAKVKLSLDNTIISFHEKEYVAFSSNYNVYGILGCYLFKNIEILKQYNNIDGNMSGVIEFISNNKKMKVDYINITKAEFFGTPEQLIEFRFNRAKKYTFFIDIDGTIFHLPKHVPDDAADTILLPGSLEKINEWHEKGHTIVLTTGRETARREKLIKQLSDMNVHYDHLVTGLASGTRYLINDKKPYCPFHKMAVGVQLQRNQGLINVEINETPTLLKVLKGGSFASVFLIKKEGRVMVRKYLEKSKENTIHYDCLTRQVDDLKRFEYYSPGSVPKILEIYDGADEYYYDMEFLEGYEELASLSIDKIRYILPSVIQKLKTDIYCYKKEIDGTKWLHDFLRDKIYAKFSMLENIDSTTFLLVNNDWVIINGNKYKGLKYFFKTSDLSSYTPSTVSPIHGDLTLENILYNEKTEEFRYIDQSGSRYVDPYEMDVGKILQSLLACYSTWDSRKTLYEELPEFSFEIQNDLLDLNIEKYTFFLTEFNKDINSVFKKGVFFLSMYLIRMIPFLLKKSNKHAHLGLLLSLYYLQK